jgi:hypothetical protein
MFATGFTTAMAHVPRRRPEEETTTPLSASFMQGLTPGARILTYYGPLALITVGLIVWITKAYDRQTTSIIQTQKMMIQGLNAHEANRAQMDVMQRFLMETLCRNSSITAGTDPNGCVTFKPQLMTMPSQSEVDAVH